MDTAEVFAQGIASNEPEDGIPVVALASTLACAAAASLLAWSLFPSRRRRASISGQVSLGLLAACAAVVVWQKRKEEATKSKATVLASLDFVSIFRVYQEVHNVHMSTLLPTLG